MLISRLAQKIIAVSEGNLHDINHLLKVYSYARTIGVAEGLPADTETILEAAALLHDIACPLCRIKYGNTDGTHQEQEGGPMAQDFLQDSGLSPEAIDRVVWLVSHHHTPSAGEDPDFRILLEADYLVNADESSYPRAAIETARDHLFRTATGRALLSAIYLEH